jgi:ribosome recycling factor
MHAIEQAIQKSELGLNPANDGLVIRLLSALSQERRQELTKIVHKKLEERRSRFVICAVCPGRTEKGRKN